MQRIEVAMAITRHTETGNFLLLKKGRWYREHRERYQETPWEVPGGKLHGDEPLEAAARRELKEEAGLEGDIVSQADPFSVVQTDADGADITITFHPFLLEVAADPDSITLTDTIHTGEKEHESYAWVAPEDVSSYLTEHERQGFRGLIEGFPWD